VLALRICVPEGIVSFPAKSLGIVSVLAGNSRMIAKLNILIVLSALAGGDVSAGTTARPGMVLAQAAAPLQIPQDAPAPADGATPAPAAASGAEQPAASGSNGATEPDAAPEQPSASDDDGASPDNLSLGEIPIIETMELTPDLARRALDSYLLTKDKYANSDLEQYENLQDFVDQTADGKNFEADIKAAGFANVSDWNLAITTVGVVYSGVVDDQTSDLLQQIKEVEEDTQLAQDMKDRMINALKAMIPSKNNKKVIEDMLADPVYGPRLKQIDIEEE
jgi:hypothetical protein